MLLSHAHHQKQTLQISPSVACHLSALPFAAELAACEATASHTPKLDAPASTTFEVDEGELRQHLPTNFFHQSIPVVERA